jgi:hypothetical protein
MNTPLLRRETFKTSRLAEFCSQRELVNQTGHAVAEWPLVITKELVDNALDAAEEAGVAPIIEVTVNDAGIAIADNGPGLAPETVADMLDYTSRVSSREAYVSPTRGAQGNGLKTILAMPFALTGERGETVIECQGVKHRIVFTIDRIRQEPRIDHVCEPSTVNTGARVTVEWPNSASSNLGALRERFLQVVEGYGWANPHLTLTVTWSRDGGAVERAIGATDLGWRKWAPSDPTSPHWYESERLGRLIGAKIAHAEDHGRACPTVREFVAEFRGLSATAKGKTICSAVGAARMSLAEFYGDGDLIRVKSLLDAMNQNGRPIKPRDLGVIGRDHLLTKFQALGVDRESFDYRRAELEHEGLPYVAEVAFGFCPDGREIRRIITGLNWSVAIGADPFRRLGPGGQSLDAILTNQRAGRNEPIVTFLHMACPKIDFLDRGKSSVVIPGVPAW